MLIRLFTRLIRGRGHDDVAKTIAYMHGEIYIISTVTHESSVRI